MDTVSTAHKAIKAWAALALAGWIGMFVLTGAGLNYPGDLSGVVYHLALVPVVLALPAAQWAKTVGFVWIFSDAALNVAAINGLPHEHVWALRPEPILRPLYGSSPPHAGCAPCLN